MHKNNIQQSLAMELLYHRLPSSHAQKYFTKKKKKNRSNTDWVVQILQGVELRGVPVLWQIEGVKQSYGLGGEAV